MAKYILVYDIGGYPEEGGGTFAEEFPAEDGERLMHLKVNELANKHKEMFAVRYAGYMTSMYKYTPVTSVTEYKPERL